MMDGEAAYLASHRAHDASELTRRWKRAARTAGWSLQTFALAGDFPLLAVTSRGRNEPALYISAGVHGDEPAPPWGLLHWFEHHAAALRERHILLLPCLNPAGLIANTRTDEKGEDLNRSFHRTDHPVIAGWRHLLAGRCFKLALCLHEDYDAQGVYVYEIFRRKVSPLGSQLLDQVTHLIPRDTRSPIDGRRVKQAVIRRARVPTNLPGTPEAIALYQEHADLSLTFETPSEYSFHRRVTAHAEFITAAVRHLGWIK